VIRKNLSKFVSFFSYRKKLYNRAAQCYTVHQKWGALHGGKTYTKKRVFGSADPLARKTDDQSGDRRQALREIHLVFSIH
jgi:hypothetical protein